MSYYTQRALVVAIVAALIGLASLAVGDGGPRSSVYDRSDTTEGTP